MQSQKPMFRLCSWKSMLLFVLLEVAFAGRDFYKILGVSRKADDAAIKKAYRGLSRKWHPDQNPDNVDEATQKFYDVSDAYETLSDPEKRAKYDLGGEEAMNGQGGGGHQGGFQRGDPFEQFRTFFQFQGGGGGFHGGFPGGQFHQAPQNLYDENSGVTEIGKPSDWNTIVDQRNGEIVIVDFYSPNCAPCKSLVEEYVSVAKTFKGIVKIAAVNCAAQQGTQICQSQKVTGYPTIRMYADKAPIEFTQEKNAKTIGAWISSTMPDVTVKITAPAKLTEFVSKAGSKAAVLLFSDKKQTPPLFKSLCRSFQSSVTCGVLLGFDPSSPSKVLPETLSAQISKTPSLFYLHDSVSFEGELFKGSMTSEILSLFFSRIISHRSRQVTVDQLTASRPNDCSAADATTCILLLDTPAKAPEQYTVLKKLAERYKADPVKFFWIDPSSKFAALFEKPASRIVAYRGKRGKYSVFGETDGTFESVNAWIDNIVTGGAGLPTSIARKPRHDEL